jgi:hypothetical protein
MMPSCLVVLLLLFWGDSPCPPPLRGRWYLAPHLSRMYYFALGDSLALASGQNNTGQNNTRLWVRAPCPSFLSVLAMPIVLLPSVYLSHILFFLPYRHPVSPLHVSRSRLLPEVTQLRFK